MTAAPPESAPGWTSPALPRGFGWTILGVAIAATALLATTLLYQRARALEAAEELARSITHVIEEQASRTLQTVDANLQLAALRLGQLREAGKLDEDSARRVLRAQAAGMPFVRAVWVLGPDGRNRFDSDPGNTGVNLADREYFRVFSERPGTLFHLSAPVLSRTNGTWLVSASRPLRSADGRLAGVIVAAVEPSNFDKLWRDVDLGDQLTIALVRRDASLMVRSPFDPALMGRPLPDPAEIARMADSRLGGQHWSLGGGSAAPMLQTFRPLTFSPDLFVLVTQPREVMLAPWWVFARLAVFLWACAAAAGALAYLMIRRAWRRSGHDQARFEQLAQAIPQIVFNLDERGRLVFINEHWTRVTGQPTAVALAGGWLEPLHPDDQTAIQENLREMILTGDSRSHERRLMGKDGMYRWHVVSAVAIRNAEGGITSWFGTVTDIEEIRRAQDALVKSDEQLRRRVSQLEATYVGAPVALAFVDPRLALVDANLRFANMCGQAVEQLAGQSLGMLLGECGAKLEPYCRQVLASGQGCANVEVAGEVPGAPGETRHCYFSCYPASDSGGGIAGATISLLDISSLVAAEGRRRSLELQLARAQRLESVGQLTGGVAHDFNNLLTVIVGNADLLAEELQDQPGLSPLAQMIGGAAQRGAELTQRLLAFAGRQALEPQVVDANRLVADMDGLLRRSLGEQVEIEVARGAGLWPALVDPAQLENALLNLCINARDAMPEGGRLTIATANAHLGQDDADGHADATPGQYVLLAVSDTGSGIAPELLGRVFEPFVTTKEAGRGSGLGLSMVYGFIKQSHGHVSIDSEPGSGTTVRLYLPRAPVAAAADTAAAPRRAAPAEGGGETILLVEDDELVRRYASGQLAALGYQVIEAAHGAAALEILRSRTDIDLLFTDVVMPGGINGRQLADAARALRPVLKVLYTSGYTGNAIAHHGRLDPGVRLLQKPYRRAELARQVRDILDARLATSGQ